MAETDAKVMKLVERELKKSPGASVSDLFEKAKKANKAIGDLSLRQFHARYPLQIKRKAKKSGRAPKAKATKAKKATKAARAKPAARGTVKPRRAKARSVGSADTATSPDRDTVRTVFLSFATDLAGAEGRKDVVKVVAGVDRYVDQVMKAVGP